jgi:multidrug efflux pump subunit AcrB
LATAARTALCRCAFPRHDELRNALADTIAAVLAAHPSLHAVDIDRPLLTPEYAVGLRRETLFRLGIDPADVGLTLRTILEGALLYEFPTDNEEVRVVLTTKDASKRSIGALMQIPVENRGNYLVPLSEIVTFRKTQSQASIERENFKRITRVVADIKPGAKVTPLEIAAQLEDSLFGAIMHSHPTTHLGFTGEIKDSRESQGTFRIATVVAIGLIFSVLALLFNSLFKPLIIMITIPFAVVGVIYAFHWHGMYQYGLFALVGVLGLMGVVINDSIIMIVKLSHETAKSFPEHIDRHVASVAQTRLRAVLLTTMTTVAGLFPSAYGIAGFDAMLAEMMLAMGWGLIFGTAITLLLVPSVYAAGLQGIRMIRRR